MWVTICAISARICTALWGQFIEGLAIANVMNALPYDRFSQWISQVKCMRQGTLQDAPTFSITLTPDLGRDTARIGEELVDYLNEFDENAAGSWAAFDSESLRVIDKHGGMKELPTWVSTPGGKPHHTVPQHQHTPLTPLLCGMARMGAVVMVENQAHVTAQQIPRVFHVRLTHPTTSLSGEDARPFHLQVNMARFGPDSMVSIIGDSALEWASRGYDPLDRVYEFMR